MSCVHDSIPSTMNGGSANCNGSCSRIHIIMKCPSLDSGTARFGMHVSKSGRDGCGDLTRGTIHGFT